MYMSVCNVSATNKAYGFSAKDLDLFFKAGCFLLEHASDMAFAFNITTHVIIQTLRLNVLTDKVLCMC